MRHFLMIILLALAVRSDAQMAMGSAEVMSIAPGETLSYDGLVLVPSSALVISGNTVTRSTAITYPSNGNPYIRRVYTFSAPLASFTGNLVMSYATGELNGLTETGLQLNLYNTTAWTQPAGTLNTTEKQWTSTLSGTPIAEVTLAASNAPLPVKLIAFTAKAVQQQSLLSWSVGGNTPLSLFTVEHSADGHSWTVAGKVTAVQAQGSYEFLHTTPVKGLNYYRLLIAEQSGGTSYSPVATVLHNAAAAAFTAYPNPAGAQVSLTCAGAGTVTLTDAAGHTLRSLPVAKGTQPLSLEGLAPGAYWLSYQGEANAAALMITKQ